MPVKIATFNVENLFSRPLAMNFDDTSIGDAIITNYAELTTLLNRTTYDQPTRRKIEALLNDATTYNGKKFPYYLEFNETRRRVFGKRRRTGKYFVRNNVAGRDDWRGAIRLKRAVFNNKTLDNTARVIETVNADVMALVEVENRPVLDEFNGKVITRSKRYDYDMLIDGNDKRGIDVALLSRLPLGDIRSHIHDTYANSWRTIFSRDCLEASVMLPDGRPLWILVNHFVSKYRGDTPAKKRRRKSQADRVAEILKRFDLRRDLVVVCGDFNDVKKAGGPLSGLLDLRHLHDVLDRDFGNDPRQRWTYYFNDFQQIDYLLASTALHDRMREAGVERRGIFELDRVTNGAEQRFSQITHQTNSASDHGAVWASFDL